MPADTNPDAAIRDILLSTRRIAVVGASDRPERPSFGVARFLVDRGYAVTPVNPGIAGRDLHGSPVVASLPDAGPRLDMVDVFRRSADAGAVAVIYALSLGFWIVAAKPIQFYYHYFVPSMALLAALALALDELRRGKLGWLAWTALVATLAVFVWFYPILSSAPLSGERAFENWMWLDSWR